MTVGDAGGAVSPGVTVGDAGSAVSPGVIIGDVIGTVSPGVTVGDVVGTVLALGAIVGDTVGFSPGVICESFFF